MATGAGLVKKNALGYNIKMSKSLYAKEKTKVGQLDPRS